MENDVVREQTVRSVPGIWQFLNKNPLRDFLSNDKKSGKKSIMIIR